MYNSTAKNEITYTSQFINSIELSRLCKNGYNTKMYNTTASKYAIAVITIGISIVPKHTNLAVAPQILYKINLYEFFLMRKV